jgi:hypothetical protein
VKKALALLEIDEIGLNQIDRDILTLLVEKFNGGPVGLKTIAASLSEEEATIEEVHEPYLMQIGLLERTPRGRVVTKKGYAHIGADYNKRDPFGSLLFRAFWDGGIGASRIDMISPSRTYHPIALADDSGTVPRHYIEVDLRNW